MSGKKNVKNIAFDWTSGARLCILSALFALGVSLCAVGTAAAEAEAVSDGKTKIRATVLVKESRALSRLGQVEEELEAVRRERIALEERRKVLETEQAVLRKELFDIFERYRLQEDKYRRLQLETGALLGGEGKLAVSEREERLSGALRRLSGDCKTLTLAVGEYCDHMEETLRELPLDKLVKAGIAWRLDDLKRKSAMLSTIAEHHVNLTPADRCRLLAVNDELRVVVLSAGAVHGVRNGLLWFSGKDRQCRLQVIAVRDFLSAAVVVEGGLKELSPGMEAVLGSGKQ